jgi:hypothetical protein
VSSPVSGSSSSVLCRGFLAIKRAASGGSDGVGGLGGLGGGGAGGGGVGAGGGGVGAGGVSGGGGGGGGEDAITDTDKSDKTKLKTLKTLKADPIVDDIAFVSRALGEVLPEKFREMDIVGSMRHAPEVRLVYHSRYVSQ